MIDADAIRQRWSAVGSTLDERRRRLFTAAEAADRRLGRPRGGLEDHRDCPFDDQSRRRRSRRGAAAEGARSPPRWRAPSAFGNRSGTRPGAQKSGRAGKAGRPDTTVDLGVVKPGEARGGDGTSDRSSSEYHLNRLRAKAFGSPTERRAGHRKSQQFFTAGTRRGSAG
jgi:hypothetical protein